MALFIFLRQGHNPSVAFGDSSLYTREPYSRVPSPLVILNPSDSEE